MPSELMRQALQYVAKRGQLLQNQIAKCDYRQIYQVIDQDVVVFVVAVDKCKNEAAYWKADIGCSS